MSRQSIGRRGKIRRRRIILGRPLRNGWRPSVARAAALGVAPALLVGAGVGALVQNDQATPDVVQAVSADTPFTFTGFGHGHGRGMGQWGAYGYAQDGWTAERIIAHYYGGTELGTVDDPMIAVRLVGRDDHTLDVYSDTGMIVAGKQLAPGEAAHLTPTPDGGANVGVTAGGSGEVPWQAPPGLPCVAPIAYTETSPVNVLPPICSK